MLANLDSILTQLSRLESALLDDSVDVSLQISKELDESIKAYFELSADEIEPRDYVVLEELLAKIEVLNKTVFKQRLDIATQLRQHVSNKKKINAYKGNNPTW